jgi:hypothetical protein
MPFVNAYMSGLSPTSVDLSMEANAIEIFKLKPVVTMSLISSNKNDSDSSYLSINTCIYLFWGGGTGV